MSRGPEYEFVEKPFCQHLDKDKLGWTWIEDKGNDPSQTFREKFTQVILYSDLEWALKTLNQEDGNLWVGPEQINTVKKALETRTQNDLVLTNKEITRQLIEGIEVPASREFHHGSFVHLRLFDFENPEKNRFKVINQLKIKLPPGRVKEHIYPDAVLFVNGIPLVVMEAKAPTINHDKIPEAIDQLTRYSNQRSYTCSEEGYEKLFYTNQILVATDQGMAIYGPLGSDGGTWQEWKETYPRTKEEVCAAMGKSELSSLEVLTEGMFSKQNILRLLQCYTIFDSSEGSTWKIIPRYQQFRAVEKSMIRLSTGKTRLLDAEHQDRRGGVIWHTQGSGKSLTMSFMVRRLRVHPELQQFKVVIITDRKDLQRQLKESLETSGQNLYTPANIRKLSAQLKKEGPEIIFATIQKYLDTVLDTEMVAESLPDYGKEFDQSLNESESILVMIDEGHRSQTGEFHTNLRIALPNSAMFAFTGTPIIMGNKKKTTEIFGSPIDNYRLKDAENDGAIVPIVYSGREVKGIVKGDNELDNLFEEFFEDQDLADEKKSLAMDKYARKGDILNSIELIKEKALNMLRFYIINILPNGLKAQVVAYSRLACVHYQNAFEDARDQILNEVDGIYKDTIKCSEEEITEKAEPIQACYYAQAYRSTLEKMDFAVIMSGNHNDPEEWNTWTDQNEQKNRISNFKKPFTNGLEDPKKGSDLGFLIVKNMLLTGFDAKIEGVIFLDRPIKEAELLQTIARVNRKYPGKTYGTVVDYFGLSKHLSAALKAYSKEDVDGTLPPLKDKLTQLPLQHKAVISLLEQKGVHGLDDIEECKDALTQGDNYERDLAEFWMAAQKFFETLNFLMPRPETKPYIKDARTIALILAKVRNCQFPRPFEYSELPCTISARRNKAWKQKISGYRDSGTGKRAA